MTQAVADNGCPERLETGHWSCSTREYQCQSWARNFYGRINGLDNMDYVCSSKLPEMWNINHLKNNLPGKPYIFNMFFLGVLEGIPYMVSENIPLWGIAEKRNMVRLKINHIYLYIYYIYVYVPIIPQIGIRYTPVLSTIPSFINGTWYLKRCVDFLYPISSPTWAF